MLTTLFFGVLFRQLVCSSKFLYPEESFGPMALSMKITISFRYLSTKEGCADLYYPCMLVQK